MSFVVSQSQRRENYQRDEGTKRRRSKEEKKKKKSFVVSLHKEERTTEREGKKRRRRGGRGRGQLPNSLFCCEHESVMRGRFGLGSLLCSLSKATVQTDMMFRLLASEGKSLQTIVKLMSI